MTARGPARPSRAGSRPIGRDGGAAAVPRTTVFGVRLYTRSAGDGVPVVLLHAFPLSSAMWLGQREGLSGVCRVITPDLRGFGGSPLGDEEPSLAVMADDVAETLDAEGVEVGVDHRAVGLAREDRLRQRWPVVGTVRFLADQRDPAAESASPQGFDTTQAGQAGTHNNDMIHTPTINGYTGRALTAIR